ncbi:hypothetical protein JCM10550A_19360 [Methanogenium cariaci]
MFQLSRLKVLYKGELAWDVDMLSWQYDRAKMSVDELLPVGWYIRCVVAISLSHSALLCAVPPCFLRESGQK